jgi:hypothetical protein
VKFSAARGRGRLLPICYHTQLANSCVLPWSHGGCTADGPTHHTTAGTEWCGARALSRFNTGHNSAGDGTYAASHAWTIRWTLSLGSATKIETDCTHPGSSTAAPPPSPAALLCPFLSILTSSHSYLSHTHTHSLHTARVPAHEPGGDMYTTMAARCSGPTRQRLQNINCHRHDTTRHRASTFEPHTHRAHTREVDGFRGKHTSSNSIEAQPIESSQTRPGTEPFHAHSC